MQANLRRNAVLVSALALFFWWGFMFAKHDSLLRPIIPFGEDPYDAVSSFGAIAAILLALLSIVRAFFPLWAGRGRSPIYVLRAQAAVPFCVLVTIAAEAVAMVRHVPEWVGKPGSARLVTLQIALTLSASAALGLIRDTKSRVTAPAAAVWAGSLLLLAFYPEQWIGNTPGHLLTVVLGATFLFVPVSALVKSWLPNTPVTEPASEVTQRSGRRYTGFALATTVGLLIGVAAYAGELSEEKSLPPLSQIVFVGSIYLGLGASGLIIAYACLGRLLGFAIGEPSLKETEAGPSGADRKDKVPS